MYELQNFQRINHQKSQRFLVDKKNFNEIICDQNI